ncbi:Rieske 2Fe-2S domain-containing protein [Lutimonas sp.]|uniref:Rieske 2Fe-2S domain-containing protein n=1 Tax=Lutimonas sp. TaxID=1872403 RepID=UPI003D9B8385
MSTSYQMVQWNQHKKNYDKFILIVVILYLILFALITLMFNSETSIETLVIRSFGSLSVILLHIILSIGPLCRINSRFMPLLYNRRHLGVIMFLLALIHGSFSIFQFHALGDTHPIYSVFTSNMDYNSVTNFPFQVLGFLALIILFLMASTSHDFFLKNLSSTVWKTLHMMVYLAYGLIVLHVFLGSFQQETSLFTMGFMIGGFLTISGLHIYSGLNEIRKDKDLNAGMEDWIYVCKLNDIAENRAKICRVDKEHIAIFKHDNTLSAVHNVCKHQGGPLGEGRIIDGCITCPWHGYQYLPHNGQSPPPFKEKLATYQLKLEGENVYLNPLPFQEGTEITPCKC